MGQEEFLARTTGTGFIHGRRAGDEEVAALVVPSSQCSQRDAGRSKSRHAKDAFESSSERWKMLIDKLRELTRSGNGQ
jgi:hypothetical protein